MRFEKGLFYQLPWNLDVLVRYSSTLHVLVVIVHVLVPPLSFTRNVEIGDGLIWDPTRAELSSASFQIRMASLAARSYSLGWSG